MYQSPMEVVCKSAEDLKRERHTPEKSGPCAVGAKESPCEGKGAPCASQNSLLSKLHVKKQFEWGTEELLLCGLILWQLLCRPHDYLLLALLVFLLIFD